MIEKKMIPWVKIPLPHLVSVLGISEITKCKAASIYGAFVRFELGDETGSPDQSTGIVVGKTPWVLVPIVDIQAAVAKINESMGTDSPGQISFDLVGGFVIFTGQEADDK